MVHITKFQLSLSRKYAHPPANKQQQGRTTARDSSDDFITPPDEKKKKQEEKESRQLLYSLYISELKKKGITQDMLELDE